jgi:hypothetical protein
MVTCGSDISIVRIDPGDVGLVVVARTAHRQKVVQCYVSGHLAGWQRPRGGQVSFALPHVGPADTVLLRAVEPHEVRTNAWAGAGGAAARARIGVAFRRDLLDGYRPGDRWRVRRGEAGGQEADLDCHQADIYPGGRGATGWGFDWGRGCWGYSGTAAPGWGTYWGYTWGFGIDYLEWTSETLPPGVYPIAVAAIDAHGNESDPCETTVVVDAFARPAAGAAVESYAPETDALVLSLTPSPDL